jgi:2-keto-4-pentenoate hydratase
MVEQMRRVFRSHKADTNGFDIAGLSLSDAYEVQDRFVAHRVQDGAKVVGWKVGCTSSAIRRQFGLSQPISAKLMEPDIFQSGDHLPSASFVDCAVEPELVFRLGADLGAEVQEQQILGALEAVWPALSCTITASGTALPHTRN